MWALKSKRHSVYSNKYRNIFFMLVLCLFVGHYAVICGQNPYVSDRYNYAIRFLYACNIMDDSIGLHIIFMLLQSLGNSPDILFFAVGFLCLLITLYSYCMYPNHKPDAILFMGVCGYPFYSFYLLKQAPAIALISLSIAAFMKRKKILCIVALISAILFHESAFIMIPLYIMLFLSNNKVFRNITYFILIMVMLFWEYVNIYLISWSVNIVPMLKHQLLLYLNEDGSMVLTVNSLTALKGVPFYIITLYAFLKQSTFKHTIPYYYQWLTLSVFASTCILMSRYMYWMWRFGAYCYFPVFLFAALMCDKTKCVNDRIIFQTLLVIFGGGLMLRELWQYYFLYGGF